MNTKSIFRPLNQGAYCVLLFALLMLLALPAAAQQQMRKAERQLAEHMNHHEMVKADFRATPSFAESLAAQPTMASNPRKAAPPRRATDYTGGVYDMVDVETVVDKSKTICDGTATNSYVPIYGFYLDTRDTEGQMIYPASTLGLETGGVIKALTFYTNRH